MDLLRIFIDTAFARVGERFLCEDEEQGLPVDKQGLVINKDFFLDICRLRHPELSDDQIRTIYDIYQDEWAYPIQIETAIQADPNIFNVLIRFADNVLRLNNDEPQVRFRHLLRWREVTQMIGEDLSVAAFMAYSNRTKFTNSRIDPDEFGQFNIDFCSWPTVLHNDNPHLKYIFEQNRLTELHSHLYASTDVFSINWVAIMNKVIGLKDKLHRLTEIHNPSRKNSLTEFLHSNILQAAKIRLILWKFITTEHFDLIKSGENLILNPLDVAELQKEIDSAYWDDTHLDYITYDIESPMGIFASERFFLFGVCNYIMRGAEINVTILFYRYILIKNLLRSFIVQVNDNKGFANFKRFQDQKSRFLPSEYAKLPTGIALWEALKLNYVDFMETRIAPPYDIKKKRADSKKMMKALTKIESGAEDAFKSEVKSEDKQEWSLIYHFIKSGNIDVTDGSLRYREIQEYLQNTSIEIRRLVESKEWQDEEQRCMSRLRGIDAASSEIGCRPEIFAQSFRYLKGAGFAATFHVGEDFYDLADGLRAIQEAILFLGLEPGDRIGHGLALGLSATDFYRERHNWIALPMQWMLDNVTWLYFKSKDFNILLPPAVETFLRTTYHRLVEAIGYSTPRQKVNIWDYYCSMQLRGDDPAIYASPIYESDILIGNVWNSFQTVCDETRNEIRAFNPEAIRLTHLYHYNEEIKVHGQRMRSFRVPEGYAETIEKMQQEIIKEISKKQLAIECCPSSNLRIGYFHRFDQHPIFRFCPPRGTTPYPLTVTVNTDDLGVFSTSLPNEYSLLALAMMKMKDSSDQHVYSSEEVYEWIEKIIVNGHKFRFRQRFG